MDRPPPDHAKLLDFWMECERGDTTTGTVLKNLRNAGMNELLEGAASVGADS